MVLRFPTRVRAVLLAGVALSLLAVPGGVPESELEAKGDLITMAPQRIDGVDIEEYTVDQDGPRISAQIPVVAGAPAFTSEIRTSMAENHTDFMTGNDGEGEASLRQQATFLAAAKGVLGARITSTREDDSGTTVATTTRWYDADSGAVLPWTALFSGEEAIDTAAAQVSRLLQDEQGVAAEDLPEGLPSPAQSSAPAAEPSEPSDVDAQAAWELADELADSPLHDVGFAPNGGLVVSLPDPAADADSGQRVRVALDAQTAQPLLSEFGVRAGEAAAAGAEGADLGGFAEPAAASGSGIDCDRVPCVALTFDDGPGEHTGEVLDALDAYSADATFYVLGQMVEEMPGVVARTAEEGHEIGSHSWKHDNLAQKSGPAVEKDLSRTAEAIEEASGEPPRTLRPPYGAFNETTLDHTDAPVILWDVDTLDWQHRDSEKVVDIAVADTRPGSVVLFHDIHKSTVDAVPDVLRRLHAKGYHFVTVSDLFEGSELKPGATYTRRD